MALSEPDLVRKVLNGDEAAQQEFLDRYELPLFKTAVHFLGINDAEVRDVVQETFVTAVAEMGSFDYRAKLGTWLNRICVLRCYERLRQRRRVVASQEESLEFNLGNLARQALEDAEEERERQEKLDAVKTAIAGLKKTCRQIIELRDFKGLSYAAIGRELAMPGGTVMSRLARCREHLKRRVLKAWKGRYA